MTEKDRNYPYYYGQDGEIIRLPWWYECGEDNVVVEQTLNRIRSEYAGSGLGCQAEIEDEMCEALWARRVGLTN